MNSPVSKRRCIDQFPVTTVLQQLLNFLPIIHIGDTLCDPKWSFYVEALKLFGSKIKLQLVGYQKQIMPNLMDNLFYLIVYLDYSKHFR